MNRIAGVPEALVSEARTEGKAWALREIPAGRGNPLAVAGKRLDDLIKWRRTYSQADIVHVHYATNGYYGWGNKPFVLHLHGSDVRQDWQKPGLRQVITHSLKRADAVICATPDLVPWVQDIRPDATWIPNPVPAEFLDSSNVQPRDKRIIFSSRWDNTKGLDLLLPLARILVERGFEVVGVDWGSDSERAAELGVKLAPLMSLPTFRDFLASGQVVVDQFQFPAFSTTDYQTLALNRPLVAAANAENAPVHTVATGDYPGLKREPERLADHIVELMNESSWENTRDWVIKNHHPAHCVSLVEEIYKQVLESGVKNES